MTPHEIPLTEPHGSRNGYLLNVSAHALPGTLMIIIALWWLWNSYFRYFNAVHRPDSYTYKSAASFSSSCCLNVPLEGILKTVIGLSLIIHQFVLMKVDFPTIGKKDHHTGESITTNTDKVGLQNTAHHMSMYIAMTLMGVTDILQFYNLLFPRDLDYASLFLAFGVEGILFYHHKEGDTGIHRKIHIFVVYTVVATMFSIVVEAAYKGHVMPALARSYFTMLQGTWMWQVSFVEFPPGGPWDPHSMVQNMYITAIFTWHALFVFVFLVVIGGLVHLWIRQQLKKEEKFCN